MINLTDYAKTKVKNFAGQSPSYAGKGFRVYVQGGGCHGFSYGFAFDTRKDDDEVSQADGVEVLVDPGSAKYLKDARIDYVEDLKGAGFVVENPNTTGSCGCGHSVSF